jgi:hypothetical protein
MSSTVNKIRSTMTSVSTKVIVFVKLECAEGETAPVYEITVAAVHLTLRVPYFVIVVPPSASIVNLYMKYR